MLDIKNILVPIDFSDSSRRSLDYALELAKLCRAKLMLLHVVDYPPSFDLPDLDKGVRETRKQYLEQLQAQVISDTVPSSIIIREGTPFLEIVRAARDHQADLIVIATHGHTGIKHLLIGSTAERVVRKSSCPVLTYRAGQREFVLP